MATHPACGLYRTTQPLEGVPPGRLVYFHNHGTPGAGIYLPRAWNSNRAEWHQSGVTVPGPAWGQSLQPVPAEGLYRVRTAFYCCEKQCVRFEPETLVQLGYDLEAHPIVFQPEWSARGLGFPERGSAVSLSALEHLVRLQVPAGPTAPAPAGGLLH
jgi:hypothetical protein